MIKADWSQTSQCIVCHTAQRPTAAGAGLFPERNAVVGTPSRPPRATSPLAFTVTTRSIH